MKHRIGLRSVFIPLLAVGLFLAVNFYRSPAQTATGGNTVQLAAPSFIHTAYAQSGNIGTKIEEEAGISAYFKADSINVSAASEAFRTIETNVEGEYIIGSVGVPNYKDHFDVHVYVNKEGWILAYYLRDDPVSKIIDIRAQTVKTTKLTTVVSAVAGKAKVPFTGEKYYHFQYPNATNMLLIAETSEFTIQLPSSYSYYERSWALNTGANFYTWRFTVDGVDMPVDYGGDTAYSILPGSELLPGATHTVTISTLGGYGILAIVYKVS